MFVEALILDLGDNILRAGFFFKIMYNISEINLFIYLCHALINIHEQLDTLLFLNLFYPGTPVSSQSN
jgi:hypothetical protein